jgi:uncharacterized protein YcbK (DUF882 family)
MNRRRFLLGAAGAISMPAMAGAAPMVSTGTKLRLVDAHTGAVFEDAYRNAKGPIPLVLEQLDLFLRDRRTGGMTGIDVGVLDFLAAIMAATGQTSANILSAYRSLQTNALLEHTLFGVADNSQHLYGRALDVSFPTELDDALEAARGMKRGGVGWYPHSHFMHIDTGPVRNWDLGIEGLQDKLLHWPAPTPVPPKGSGTMLVEGKGQITIGGGKPMAVASGRSPAPEPAAHRRVAGILRPATDTQ